MKVHSRNKKQEQKLKLETNEEKEETEKQNTEEINEVNVVHLRIKGYVHKHMSKQISL
jgi:hypothetical protein